MAERLPPTFPSTASPSKKPSQFSAIRWLGYLTTRTIQSKNGERSSWGIHPAVVCWSCASRSGMSGLEYSVRGERLQENGRIMRKTSRGKRTGRVDMRREYRFDYRKSRPNRFARLMKGRTVAIVLDPDVASVCCSSESVTALLRSVIKALPKRVKA